MGGESDSREVSRILRGAGEGEPVEMAVLFPLVYDRLRSIASRHMAAERPSHTLSATALVHEAYLKLVGREPLDVPSKARFYSAAAEAMRRLLIDHARARGSAKRGGGRRGVALDVVDLAVREDPAEILSLDEALSRLSAREGRLGEVVRLRFFAGLPEAEIAEVLGVTVRTVRRDWAFARAWLERELGEGE